MNTAFEKLGPAYLDGLDDTIPKFIAFYLEEDDLDDSFFKDVVTKSFELKRFNYNILQKVRNNIVKYELTEEDLISDIRFSFFLSISKNSFYVTGNLIDDLPYFFGATTHRLGWLFPKYKIWGEEKFHFFSNRMDYFEADEAEEDLELQEQREIFDRMLGATDTWPLAVLYGGSGIKAHADRWDEWKYVHWAELVSRRTGEINTSGKSLLRETPNLLYKRNKD